MPSRRAIRAAILLALFAGLAACRGTCDKACSTHTDREVFHLRPDVEKAYGYSHAVRVGDRINISGAVSMDDAGSPTAVGDMAQQMKNCYADLDAILKHYGCTFDDVVVENIYTTNMAKCLEISGYRAEIYRNGYPAGSWIEVKGLALPEFLIEIELEVHKAGR